MENKNTKSKFDEVIKELDEKTFKKICNIPSRIKEEAQEIRLRVNRPIAIYCANKMYYLTEHNEVVSTIYNGKMSKCTQENINATFQHICKYSIYSYQNEIKNGFITMSGGHRVGICGTAIYKGDKIENIKDISSINIRIAREVVGCSNKVIKNIGTNFKGLLVCGPPSCGKTTVLRDLALTLSQTYDKKVAVIDERGEISGTHLGLSQNDLGQSDVLNGYKKGEGILQAVRCLSPEIVICDEVGASEDIEAITQGLNAGVSIIASIHANNKHELLNKPQGIKLLNTNAFENILFFKGREQIGEIKEILSLKELLSDENSRSNSVSKLCDFDKHCSISKISS